MVENFNSAGNDLFYGKAGDLTGDDHENVEISALALHLIAAAITYLDTHLIQIMLRDRAWRKRRLTALFWSHLNLYGRFELDMNRPLELDGVPLGRPSAP